MVECTEFIKHLQMDRVTLAQNWSCFGTGIAGEGLQGLDPLERLPGIPSLPGATAAPWKRG